jgi:hypothetical protein
MDGATPVFRVQYRLFFVVPQIRFIVYNTAGSQSFTSAWSSLLNAPINSQTSNSVEVYWKAGSSTTFRMYLNGALQPGNPLIGSVNSNTSQITTVRLGPQNVPAASIGAEYFDSFVSTRTTVIGQ